MILEMPSRKSSICYLTSVLVVSVINQREAFRKLITVIPWHCTTILQSLNMAALADWKMGQTTSMPKIL